MSARERPFLIALALAFFVGPVVERPIPYAGDSVALNLVGAVVIVGVLGHFNHERRRWPKWALLVVIGGQLVTDVWSLSATAFRLPVDLAAVGVLLYGWTTNRKDPEPASA